MNALGMLAVSGCMVCITGLLYLWCRAEQETDEWRERAFDSRRLVNSLYTPSNN